jgi:hypothetical protein
MALEATGRPMTCREMVAWAEQQGKLETKGRTPVNTLNVRLLYNIENDRKSPFRRAGKGLFDLKSHARSNKP